MMKKKTRPGFSRRQFIQSTAFGVATAVVAPAVITAAKSDTRIILGQGDHQFEVNHDWAQLPAEYSWQTTHNVAVDKAGRLYVIHEGRVDQEDHPSIFVFDRRGRFIRAFGSQFQGGGHGIEVHEEDGQEFLYVCAYQHLKTLAKMDLKGETVWQKYAPMQSGVYAPGEDTRPEKVWGRDRFLPTNFAFLPDGDFLRADGYGSYYIHRMTATETGKAASAGRGRVRGRSPHRTGSGSTRAGIEIPRS